MLQGLFTRHLRAGQVAIDIGAHTGGHTFAMAEAIAPGGRVIAIEPLARCCDAIRARLRAERARWGDTIEVHRLALADYEGESEFCHAIDNPGYSGLKPRAYDTPTRVEKVAVRVTTLDALARDLSRVDYIKIDAEGGEYHIVLGAAKTLERHRPLVTFEFGANSIDEYKITCADMGAFWRDAGYAIYDITGRPLETVEAFVASSTQQAVWDYVAIPNDKPRLRQLFE
jgi:FkbM family methyltransferase